MRRLVLTLLSPSREARSAAYVERSTDDGAAVGPAVGPDASADGTTAFAAVEQGSYVDLERLPGRPTWAPALADERAPATGDDRTGSAA